jgi:predicted PurR-regulated permease PerM
MNPIFYGIVIAYVLNKILNIFEKKVFAFLDKKEGRARLKRTLSLLCTYVSVIAFIALFILLIAPQVVDGFTDLVNMIPFYIETFSDWLYSIADMDPAIYEIVMKGIGYLETLYGQLGEIVATVIPKITELLGQILTFLKDITIGIILSVYFLLQKERFVAQGKRIARAIFRDGGYGRAIKLMKDIDNSFGGYLVAMGVDSFLVMCECFVVFAIANIPYYPLISFIIGVTNFIPFFGPFIGAIPSAIIIFIADPTDPMKVILFGVLILLIQQIDGNVIAPKIIGSHIGISSVWVVIAVTVMSGFFGFIGMVIGVPLFSVIYTIIDNAIAHKLEIKNCDTEIFDFYSDEDNMGRTMEIEMMRAEELRNQKGSWIDGLWKKTKKFCKKCFRKRKNEETTVMVEEIVTEEFDYGDIYDEDVYTESTEIEIQEPSEEAFEKIEETEEQ